MISTTEQNLFITHERSNTCIADVWAKNAKPLLCTHYVECTLYCTSYLHSFSLHNVDIIFRASIITIQAQGSPEVGPQLAMASDKGTNYFSVGKQEAEWTDGNSVRVDKTQWHLTDNHPPNVLGFILVAPACCIKKINLSVKRYDHCQVHKEIIKVHNIN